MSFPFAAQDPYRGRVLIGDADVPRQRRQVDAKVLAAVRDHLAERPNDSANAVSRELKFGRQKVLDAVRELRGAGNRFPGPSTATDGIGRKGPVLVGAADGPAAESLEQTLRDLRRQHATASKNELYRLVRGGRLPGARRADVLKALKAASESTPRVSSLGNRAGTASPAIVAMATEDSER